MDQGYELPRELKLKKAFKMIARTLLTACSREEFLEAFSAFRRAKQDVLYQLFIHVIAELHENIEEDFESICAETQVAATFDKVEQLEEEQKLDTLAQDKTNLLDVKQELSRAKKAEISYLTSALEKAVAQNLQMKTHIESLRIDRQDYSVPDAVKKLRSWYQNSSQAP
ncbi:uncharacterized protein LOC113297586 isoform X1 [Papaver somniferum]|uniref:uncharacterized protein LOC113297586 isoform X1 n=1 Tax=Papaver somniferum TaxID=3469 RepID=UPI000E6FCD8E|nr:uncharacterized protein LOC113297586 isoform X1 [Papaver somniferum]